MRTVTIMRWLSYLISFAYIGILLFFFIGEMIHAFKSGTGMHMDSKSITILSILCAYCLSLITAIKWDIPSGIVGLLLITLLNTMCHIWHSLFYMGAIVAPILYITAGIMTKFKIQRN